MDARPSICGPGDLDGGDTAVAKDHIGHTEVLQRFRLVLDVADLPADAHYLRAEEETQGIHLVDGVIHPSTTEHLTGIQPPGPPVDLRPHLGGQRPSHQGVGRDRITQPPLLDPLLVHVVPTSQPPHALKAHEEQVGPFTDRAFFDGDGQSLGLVEVHGVRFDADDVLSGPGCLGAQPDILHRLAGSDHQIQIIPLHHLVVVIGGDGARLFDGRASVLQVAMRDDHQLRSGVILQLAHRSQASIPVVQPDDTDPKCVCHGSRPFQKI